MKYKSIIITNIACLLMFAGCEIEQISYGRLDPGVFPSNYNEADELMLGEMYYGFSSWYIMNSTQGWWMRSNIVSDEFVAKDYVACYAGFDLNPQADLTQGYGGYPVGDEYTDWNLPFFFYAKYMFKSIQTMDKIKDVPMTDEQRRLLNAQLHCGIGWIAFMEYDMYGPIPLPGLEILQHPRDNVSVPRVSEVEMQTFIEEHLKAAFGESTVYENTYVDPTTYNDPKTVGLLPHKWDGAEYGRFNKGLAKAVLLDHYLLVGGMKYRYPGFDTRDGRDAMWYWTEAKKIAEELEDPKYAQFGWNLAPEYNSLFTKAGKRNEEVIYSWVMYQDYGLGISPQCLPPDYPGAGNLVRWNVYKMPWRFYDSFEAEDTIRTRRIIAEYKGTTDTVHTRARDTLFARSAGEPLNLGPLPLKYEWESMLTSEKSTQDVDVPLYRRAGNKLLLAELIVRTNNAVTSDAIDLVNQVRTRVKLGSIADRATALGKNITNLQDFFDLLLDERGHELWFEGHRRGDLIRFGKFVDVSQQKARDAKFPNARIEKIAKQENNVFVYERFPIPNRAITESSGVITQNPGY